MIAGCQVLAVVPARGGSKGIPLKNLRTIGGRSLVARAGDVIQNIPEIDRAVVSTDNAEIAKAADDAGLDVPFMRPDALSRDYVADVDVLTHALVAIEAIDSQRYDIVLMLQPTSPLRTPAQVQATLRMLVEQNWDSVWTVSLSDSKAHPLKQLTLVNGRVEYYDPRGKEIIARQQLQKVYHRNGVAYAVTRSCLLEQGTLKGTRAGAIEIPGEHVSIDTEVDLLLAELLLARRALD